MRTPATTSAVTTRSVTMPVAITNSYSICLTKHCDKPNANGYCTYNTYKSTFQIIESAGGNASYRIIIIGY